MSTAIESPVLEHDRLYIGGEWVAPADPGATHRGHQPGHRAGHRPRSPGHRRRTLRVPSRPPERRSRRWSQTSVPERAAIIEAIGFTAV